MNFESLVGRINLIQDALQAQVAHAVNFSLTARNWLVGYYIVGLNVSSILRLPSAKLQTKDFLTYEKWRMLSAKLEELSMPLNVSHKTSLSANTAYSCPLRMTSVSICWRISRKSSSGRRWKKR